MGTSWLPLPQLRHHRHSPLFYLCWELRPGARAAPPDEHEERALFAARGSIELAGSTFRPGQLIILSPGPRPIVTAIVGSTVVGLGGTPLGERFVWWNLVSSRAERIEQAKADWAAGRMSLPRDDEREWIPLA